MSNFELVMEQLEHLKEVVDEMAGNDMYRFALDFDALDEFRQCRSVEEAVAYLEE